MDAAADGETTTMSSQISFRITSKSAQDMGTYQGASEVDALAAMHRDAGYDVTLDETGTELVFASESDREICGDIDDWTVRPVSD
jgi:hypothetical protein